MCYSCGSVDQALNICPMCKVFKPKNPKCPHVRDICRNRTLHPRFDVLYLKNAEVDCFNGCGYCKWARTNPPAKQAGYNNLGWPGCCRPPALNEYRLVQPADWPSISVVHHVSIPAEIKAVLEGLSSRGSPIPALSASLGRAASVPSSGVPLDRKNSGNTTPPSKSMSLSGKVAAVSVPTKPRSGGSPQQATLALASNRSTASSSVPNASAMEQYHTQRRQTHPDTSEKRVDQPHSSHSSPNRKHVDLENTITPRRNSSGTRPSIINASTPSPPATTTRATDTRSQTSQTLRRRGSISNSPPRSSPPRPVERTAPALLPRPLPPKKEGSVISSASSSSGSEGLGSMTDSTVTSDGGFTDYLSDESEAELQRQAEAKAALVAQNQAEEMEFKLARQRLANVDLHPPKSWTALGGPSTTSATPRYSGVAHQSSSSSYSSNAAFATVPYTSSPMASHSRS